MPFSTPAPVFFRLFFMVTQEGVKMQHGTWYAEQSPGIENRGEYRERIKERKINMAHTAYVTNSSDKKRGKALVLCLFGGFFGLHQFYVGKVGKGILYACTMGLFFFGWFFDLIRIINRKFTDNVGNPLRH